MVRAAWRCGWMKRFAERWAATEARMDCFLALEERERRAGWKEAVGEKRVV